jgi:Ti-type conjugative transfer relaxase TraA
VAIQFARARYIARSTGGSAVRSAAYNERSAITSDRTGELYYFKHRDAPEHHQVLLPDGADPRLADSAVLWNAAEAAEKRKDAQVAREIVLALPSDAGISSEDRIELARSFAEQHFVAKGLAVQLDVHAPHAGESDVEGANWHAHLLITTRRLEGENFATKKARDLDPEIRRAGGRAVVADAEAWGALWRDHQNRYFHEHGLDLRVDPTATHAGQHIGPVRMRKAESGIAERAEVLRQANEAAARDPDQVLTTLTRHNATFTEGDLDRHLGKHIADDGARVAVKAAVMERPEVIALHDRETGESADRFTTRAVRDQERAALADAARLARARTTAVPSRVARAALAPRTPRPDQRAAFDHAIAPGNLKLIEGRAGTGKSFTLAAIRDAHALDRRRVIGLAPTNVVAQDLKADGFTEAGTVHAELFRLKNGRTQWDAKTVVVVDEAAMLDSRVTGELLAAAKAAGAKLILAGDDRQLASIERGGLFTELRQRHGAAEISEVVRQRVDWQRQAARDLAEGRFAEAVTAFDRAGAITWTNDQADARQALVTAWSRDTAANPNATRFVFAYTNRDVDALNAALRQVRRDRGELAEPDMRFETKHGPAGFAIGDRVQFTDTDKRARIYNGNVGTLTGIDAGTGRLTATLDGGRDVTWFAGEFQGFRHGYAGTIYKGQGKTLDHTYLYHTTHWRSAASYVALTRQRESAQVFAARETARDATQLARQMARFEVKAASVAWATRDELAPALRPAAARSAPRPQAVSQDWLIPPFVSSDGRDSLGRGLDTASIAAAVARDEAVQKARAEPWHYLTHAYRDPNAAHARLNDLVTARGWTGAASRLAADPTQLGRLRGRDGMFASRSAQLDRAHAISAAWGVSHGLTRIAEAEQRADRGYRASVEAQRTRDAVGVPSLSPAATAALEAVLAVRTAAPGDTWSRDARRDQPEVARAWETGRRDPAVAAAIDRFQRAAEQRLGEDGIRAALRNVRDGSPFSVPGVEPRQQPTLNQLARGLVAARSGRTDHRIQQEHEVFERSERQQQRTRHRQGPSLGR